MTLFDANPEAYARWWLALTDRRAAFGLLEELFEQGTWKQAPEHWLNCLSWALHDAPIASQAHELRCKFVAQITRGTKIDEHAFVAVPILFRTTVSLTARDAEALSQWLYKCAEPNDAAVIADVLEETVWAESPELVRACHSLFDWAYGLGSSELRSSRRGDLNLGLLGQVLAQKWDDLLLPAVRLLMYSPPRLHHYFLERQGIEILASAAERHLANGGAAAIVGDVVAALASDYRELYLEHVLRRPSELVLSWREVLRRLASGDVESQNGARVWSIVVSGPPEAMSIRQPDTSRRALEGLAAYATDRWRAHGLGKHPPSRSVEERAWAVSLLDAFFRTTNVLRERRPDDIALLERFFRANALNRNIVEALHGSVLDAVRDADDAASTALRDLMGSPGVGPEVVQAMIPLLRQPAVSSAPSKPNPTDTELLPVRAILQQLLERQGERTGGCGLLAIPDSVRRVEFGELENERAFVVREDALMLSRKAIADIVVLAGQPTERDATAVLYCLHELVHEAQGIAEKPEVNRLRFTGAESALMHLDLGADHVAAAIASQVFPEWDLLWLKDLQARSLVAFPAGPRHPEFARLRKVLRLVGLRADRLMRTRGLGDLGTRADSYGFVDFGPGGGHIAFLVNWPPFAVVKTALLSREQASALFQSVDEPTSTIDRVDEVLSAVLDASG